MAIATKMQMSRQMVLHGFSYNSALGAVHGLRNGPEIDSGFESLVDFRLIR